MRYDNEANTLNGLLNLKVSILLNSALCIITVGIFLLTLQSYESIYGVFISGMLSLWFISSGFSTAKDISKSTTNSELLERSKICRRVLCLYLIIVSVCVFIFLMKGLIFPTGVSRLMIVGANILYAIFAAAVIDDMK